MSMQDPIADMLTCIRNAQAMGIQQVRVSHSKLKGEILRVLQEEGYIQSYEVISADNKKDVQVSLKYYQGRSVIEKIRRISCPSLRVYKDSKNLPLVRGGLGVAILSTSIGIMTDKTARAKHVGGEILCTVE